jgi:hypothetical protein
METGFAAHGVGWRISMTLTVREAEASDVSTMVALSEQKRTQAAKHQPQFWRIAEGASEVQAKFFNSLIEQKRSAMLIAESGDGLIEGFIIAGLNGAPPVYHPGGLTCVIDDFCVSSPDKWLSVGKPLLDAVFEVAKKHGAVQAIVVCGHWDEAKREMLKAIGCTMASEWWHLGI